MSFYLALPNFEDNYNIAGNSKTHKIQNSFKTFTSQPHPDSNNCPFKLLKPKIPIIVDTAKNRVTN